jgi:GMP synthase (glutamine-hydrolysing)
MTPLRRTAVVLRHVAFEDLGLLAPILDEAGWDASYCDAPIEALNDPSIAAADLLIVLGQSGSMTCKPFLFWRGRSRS